LHGEELHDVHSSPDMIKMFKSMRMRWAEHVAHVRANVGKPDRGLGGPRHRWKNNIKTVSKARYEGVDCIRLNHNKTSGDGVM
jgi:hypothetical protein